MFYENYLSSLHSLINLKSSLKSSGSFFTELYFLKKKQVFNSNNNNKYFVIIICQV